MGARFINNDGTPISKLVGVKKQYENINGVFEPVYYDGYVLFNGLTAYSNAYIDLGHQGDSSNTFICDCTLLSIPTSNENPFGSIGSAFNSLSIYSVCSAASINISKWYNSSNSNSLSKAIAVGRYKLIASNAYVSINSSTQNGTTPSYTTAKNIFAFAGNNNGTPYQYFKGIIHSFKEYSSSGVLLYHYVPARRNSDNKLGLLDVVNGVFYTNAAGSGSFSV